MQPLVTVIMPVSSKHVEYLPDAIRSLTNQTVQAHQLVIVNDTGKSLRVDAGATVLNTQGRQGAAIARNLGIERTQTPFVVFLDADDLMVNTAMETLLRAYATYAGPSYLYGDAWTMGGDGQPALYYNAPLYDRQFLLSQRNIHNVTALLPTRFVRDVGGFDEVTRGWEDWDFYIRLAIAGYCGVKVPVPLILYRLHTGQNRAFSGTIGNELVAEVRTRYGEYIEGRKPLMGCCGEDEQAKQAALAFVQGLPPEQRSGEILLEYIGRNAGSIPFRVNGRTYRGADNPQDKFVRAKPEDVTTLLAQGVWRQVPESVLRAQQPQPLASPVQARRKIDPADGVTVPQMETARDLASTVSLVTCAKCGHIVNFHLPGGCQAIKGDQICGCAKFEAPAPKEGPSNDRPTHARARTARGNAKPAAETS